MKLLKIIALTILTILTTFAAERTETLEDLKPVVMKVIQNLEGENESLRKQLGLKTDPSFRTPQLSFSSDLQSSLQEESPETGGRICRKNIHRFKKMAARYSF